MFWNRNHAQAQRRVIRPSFRSQLEYLEERCLPDATQVLPLPSGSSVPSQQQIAANLAQNGIPIEILVNQVAIDQLGQANLVTQPLTTTRLVQIIQNQVEGHFDQAMAAEVRGAMDLVKIGLAGATFANPEAGGFGMAKAANDIRTAVPDVYKQAEIIAENTVGNKQAADQDLAELAALEAYGAASMVQTEESIASSILRILQQTLFGHPQPPQPTQSTTSSGSGPPTSSGTGNGQGSGGSHLTFASGQSRLAAGNGSGAGIFAGKGSLTLV